ncbi:MAG: DNA polymerase [Candidatus Thorarchaeota archaeon]
MVIALGNVALFALTDRMGITKWRGSILKSTLCPSKTVIPTFHPATVIRPKNQYLNKHCILFDLKRAKSIIEGTYEPTERKLITGPGYYDSLNFLDDCMVLGSKGQPISYDIEISNMEVSCISFSYQLKSICIPFIDGNGDYFTVEQEADIWRKIAQLLEDEHITKVGQNLTFDVHFLLRKFGIAAKNLQDTMIKQRILMPEFKIGLDFITSVWTDHPYYKEDGKFWLEKASHGSWVRGWEYNAIDSIICDEASPKQDDALVKQGNMDTYNRSRRIILPLVYMMERGIKINVKAMARDYKKMGEAINEMELELNRLASQPLNAKSPKQLKDYFYKKCGLKPYKKKGKPSTDEMAMKRISRLGYPEAAQVLKIRGATKERSTYLDVEKVDKDERMRCSYNPAGTRFSRLSSSVSIFGTGNNMQNQPHHILKYFYADPGYIVYEIDLSQAENRIVAYVGRIDPMIEAFETGKDVHSLTGALISGKTPEEIKWENDHDIFCSLGSGDKTWRMWGKRGNHGLNYDLGYRQFALYYEIPESQGKVIVNRYHMAYPGVRQNFHSYVKQNLIKNRTLTNLMGRKTLFLGDLKDQRQRDQVFKEAYACIPQGTVGDLINERGMNFVYYQHGFEELELIMQVHDSIKFQIPISIGWKRHAEMLIRIKQSLEIPLVTHYGREFVVPADLSIGYCLDASQMKELKGKAFSENVSELSDRLEQVSENLRPMKDFKFMWE